MGNKYCSSCSIRCDDIVTEIDEQSVGTLAPVEQLKPTDLTLERSSKRSSNYIYSQNDPKIDIFSNQLMKCPSQSDQRHYFLAKFASKEINVKSMLQKQIGTIRENKDEGCSDSGSLRGLAVSESRDSAVSF
jgi:hypothetical protein